MPPVRNNRAEVQAQKQKEKLANSYSELLREFSSKELGSVGNYTVGRLIGKGSFGKVYLATHKLTNGSKVVLKSSSKEDTNLAREIHHHRQFLHPHIARLYEVVVTENLVWLVLEYCPGDELYNYLIRHGPLPVDKVKRIFTQLVGAVAYVHSKSCVHRDLKLENILLDKRKNVKLCDFGFTREYEGKSNYLQTFCGTVCYSAPEMLKAEKYAGEKVDVWSLGIILYALLAGELPFDEDDDQATKQKILTEEPVYTDKFPDDAKALISSLLSKRPLLRPSLEEILSHPFLSEHASEQLATLKIPQPAPFTTPLEKTALQRMKSAGVNVDEVVENVLAQKCDPLAGWWALLIEKEQRKEQRRESKRRERDVEAKNLRRISAASTRLERMSAILPEVDEEGHASSEAASREQEKRGRQTYPPQLPMPELPSLTAPVALQQDTASAPAPADKESIGSVGSARYRPTPPPKDNRKTRPSTLHTSSSQPELAQQHVLSKRRGRRHHNPIISQLASLKHWVVDYAKRARSPNPKATGGSVTHRKSHPDKHAPAKDTGKDVKQTPETDRTIRRSDEMRTPTQVKRASNASSLAASSASYSNNRQSYPRQHRSSNVNTPNNRNSLSPSPITPRNSYRRSSAGLRGRKSTSSSVSSIRSIYHTKTHSKTSSASSTSGCGDGASTPTARAARSPHPSVKVLPTSPTASARFPSHLRYVRRPGNGLREAGDLNDGMHSAFNEGVPAPLMHSPSSSLVFARRKKSAFKGPMIHTANLMFSSGMASSPVASNGGFDTAGVTTTTTTATTAPGRPAARRSQIIVEEEDAEDEDIEEVDTFSGPDENSTIVDEEPNMPGGGGSEAVENVENVVVAKADDESGDVLSPEPDHRPMLAPSPDIDSSSSTAHPPRSSSLRASQFQSVSNQPGEGTGHLRS